MSASPESLSKMRLYLGVATIKTPIQLCKTMISAMLTIIVLQDYIIALGKSAIKLYNLAAAATSAAKSVTTFSIPSPTVYIVNEATDAPFDFNNCSIVTLSSFTKT